MSKNYKAYLLRLQRSEDQSHWRTTLQNAQTGEVLHFANEQAFVQYLLNLLSHTNEPSKHADSA